MAPEKAIPGLPSERCIRALTAALVLVSFLPVGLAAERPVRLWICLAIVAAGFVTQIVRGRPLLRPAMAGALAVVAFVWAVVETFVVGTPSVLNLAHFLMVFAAVKLCSTVTLRDASFLTVLSLLLVVVGAIVCGTLLYPLVLAVVLVLTPRLLMLMQIRREADRCARRPIGPPPRAQSLGSAPAMRPPGWAGAVAFGGGCLAVGLATFFAFPRVGAGMFGQGPHVSAGGITGFTSQIRFGDIGRVAVSDRPVLRVEVRPEPSEGDAANRSLLLRGSVLDHYGTSLRSRRWGWRWRASEADDDETRGAEVGGRILPILAGVDPSLVADTVTQRVWMEPVETIALFALYPPIAVSTSEPQAIRKNLADQTLVRVQGGGRAFAYTVVSAPKMPPEVLGALAREREGHEDPRRYLGPHLPSVLPAASRIRALAEEWTRDVGPVSDPANHLAVAQRICDELRSGRFGYTLDRSDVDLAREPIEDFLFYRRRGHCEYFASAMTVMCQLLGVPARVAQGFRASEYNPVGGYYLVRQRDAHAWVEVFDARRDWVAFDPTPASSGPAARDRAWLAGVRKYLDYVQFHWATGIVAYDAESRAETFRKIQNWLRSQSVAEAGFRSRWAQFLWDLTFGPEGLTARERLLYWIVLGLLLAFVVFALHLTHLLAVQGFAWAARAVRESRRPPRRGAAELYERFAKIVAHKGIVRPPQETPREFVDRLVRDYPQLAPASEIVAAFYASEYGGIQPPATTVAPLHEFLGDLVWGRIPLVRRERT